VSQTSPNAALPAAPLARLSAGSSSWVSCDAGGRAALALETAQTVAAQADRWVEVSLAIKAAALAHSSQHRSAIEAEDYAGAAQYRDLIKSPKYKSISEKK